MFAGEFETSLKVASINVSGQNKTSFENEKRYFIKRYSRPIKWRRKSTCQVRSVPSIYSVFIRLVYSFKLCFIDVLLVTFSVSMLDLKRINKYYKLFGILSSC